MRESVSASDSFIGRRGDFSIFLMGNSNTGKTTLFNELTGAREKVGNRSGITVELVRESFQFRNHASVTVADMPGLYSMSVHSTDEEVVISAFLEQTPDVILNVVDASNLERNLYLTLQLLEMRIPMLVVLKMRDIADETGMLVDCRRLSALLGVPVIVSDEKSGVNIELIKQRAAEVYQTGATSLTSTASYWRIRQLSRTILRIEQLLSESLIRHPSYDSSVNFSIEGMAVRFLEKDEYFIGRVFARYPALKETLPDIEREIARLEKELGETSEIIIAENRYQSISEICNQSLTRKKSEEQVSRYDFSDRLDAVLANHWLGIPMFALIMYVLFYLTFHLGAWPVVWLQDGFHALQTCVKAWGGDGLFTSLLADGIIGGVGGTLVFLPNIFLLFFFISILEATGYMSRVAFLMDALMRRTCGIQGKAIIPLVLGFGCNVPAIMATRSLESRKSRLITIFVLPLMSCGARLPVYTLITGALFDLKYQPVVILSVYLLGLALAFGLARILSLFVERNRQETILTELPPYQIPPMKNVLYQVFDYTGHFLVKVGTFVLAASIVLWAIGIFPRKTDYSQNYASQRAAVEQSETLSPAEKETQIRQIAHARELERYDYTFAGRIGTHLEPVFRPLGFDKKIILSLLGAVASKELFVSQMQILYFSDSGSLPEGTPQPGGRISRALRQAYSPLTGYCVMLFCLIGIPCLSTFAVVRQETGSWFWPAIQWFGLTALAWFVTFAIHQIFTAG
ncbi:MAG: ferrous iron transport protein B [Planctomycetia bacterium]|nr:ferrous iron transport protein B [Planctomycetia bacterium]